MHPCWLGDLSAKPGTKVFSCSFLNSGEQLNYLASSASTLFHCTVRLAAVVAMWSAYTQHAAVLRCRAKSMGHRLAARQLAMAMLGWAGIAEEARALRAKMRKIGHARFLGLQVGVQRMHMCSKCVRLHVSVVAII